MRLILCLLVLGSMASCVSSAKMARQLNSRKVALGYIHDSQIKSGEKTMSVSVEGSVNTADMPAQPDVYRLRGYAVPALIYNGWGQVLECNMGASQLDGDPMKFINQAMERELLRSTSLAVEPASDVKLLMEIKQLDVKGPYSTKGFIVFLVFFAFWGEEQYAGPSRAKCEIKYTLVKGNTTLFEKSIITDSTLEPLAIQHGDFKMLRKTYSVIMGEQLSNAIKENIERGAREIDNVLSGMAKK